MSTARQTRPGTAGNIWERVRSWRPNKDRVVAVAATSVAIFLPIVAVVVYELRIDGVRDERDRAREERDRTHRNLEIVKDQHDALKDENERIQERVAVFENDLKNALMANEELKTNKHELKDAVGRLEMQKADVEREKKLIDGEMRAEVAENNRLRGKLEEMNNKVVAFSVSPQFVELNGPTANFPIDNFAVEEIYGNGNRKTTTNFSVDTDDKVVTKLDQRQVVPIWPGRGIVTIKCREHFEKVEVLVKGSKLELDKPSVSLQSNDVGTIRVIEKFGDKTRDITREAEVEVEEPKVVSIRSFGRLIPEFDGKSRIRVICRDQIMQVPVEVGGMAIVEIVNCDIEKVETGRGRQRRISYRNFASTVRFSGGSGKAFLALYFFKNDGTTPYSTRFSPQRNTRHGWVVASDQQAAMGRWIDFNSNGEEKFRATNNRTGFLVLRPDDEELVVVARLLRSVEHFTSIPANQQGDAEIIAEDRWFLGLPIGPQIQPNIAGLR